MVLLRLNLFHCETVTVFLPLVISLADSYRLFILFHYYALAGGGAIQILQKPDFKWFSKIGIQAPVRWSEKCSIFIQSIFSDWLSKFRNRFVQTGRMVPLLVTKKKTIFC